MAGCFLLTGSQIGGLMACCSGCGSSDPNAMCTTEKYAMAGVIAAFVLLLFIALK